MKKLLLFLLLTNIGQVYAQYTAIPDPYFEQDLINKGIDSEGILDGQVLTADIETVTFLSYLSPYILDMTGIEDFAALEVLYCDYILQLFSLDVSQNTNLEELYCNSTPLSTLNISGCINLKKLNCGPSGLSTLDLSNNILLEYLVCNSNYLTSLDVSNNILLEYLVCNSNYLTSLDVSNNINLQYFDCSSNQLTHIDLSTNVELIGLGFSYNTIQNVDLTNNVNLELFSCNNTLISELDLSQNIKLKWLRCYDNDLSQMDLDQNPLLEILHCYDNGLEGLHIQNGANQMLAGTFVASDGSIQNRFRATGNPDLTCIFVDDAYYCTENWPEVDPASTFVETQEECDALAINDIEQTTFLAVFPNPVKGVFYVNSQIPIKKVMIFTNLGVLVKSFSIEESYPISDLQQGIYLLRVETEEGILAKNIVVE